MSIVINTKKDVLSSLACPTCGARVNYKPGDTYTMCLYCGNTFNIKQVEETVVESNGSNQADASGKPESMVSKIDTSSSALAYINYYFNSFDWESYAYGTECRIYELDEIVEKMKVLSADNYKTWVAAFLVTVTPFAKKIEYRKHIFENILNEFKKNNLDAYGMYDSYKKAGLILKNKHDSVLKEANDYLAYANEYGIPKNELDTLKKNLKEIEVSGIEDDLYDSIIDIPEIKKFIVERDKEIAKKLKEKGLDAEELYARAQTLVECGNYNAALPPLYTLGNYKDCAFLARKISSLCVLNSEVFVQNNKCFLIRNKDGVRTLRDITNKEEAKNVLAKHLPQHYYNYGNLILYFEEPSNVLVAYDLNGKQEVFRSKNSYGDAKTMLLEKEGKFLVATANQIKALDLVTFKFTTIVDKLGVFYNFIDHYAVYSLDGSNSVFIIDLLTKESFSIVTNASNLALIGDLAEDKLVYTLRSPSQDNRKLVVYDFKKQEKYLVERNIEGHCSVIDGTLFYLVRDNKGINYLISRDTNCENRKEICSYVSKALFISGDYLYFIRSNRYNTALCKVNLVNPNGVKTIATQIDEFVKVENGELYYVDDRSALRKVRMNGTYNQLICSRVKTVLLAGDDHLVFQASDGESIDSLYAVKFNEEGHRKLAYHITDSQLYDEKTVYYIWHVYETKNGVPSWRRKLCKQDLETYEETVIFDITAQAPQPVSNGLAVFLGIIGGILAVAAIVCLVVFINNVSAYYNYERDDVLYGFLVAFFILISFSALSIFGSWASTRKNKKIREENQNLI